MPKLDFDEATRLMDLRYDGEARTDCWPRSGKFLYVCEICIRVVNNEFKVDQKNWKLPKDPDDPNSALSLAGLLTSKLGDAQIQDHNGALGISLETLLESLGDPNVEGATHFDLTVEGPKVFIFKIEVENLFARMSPIKFHDPHFAKYYSNLFSRDDGKYFVMFAEGSPEHMRAFRDENGANSVQHTFDINCMMIDISNCDLPADEISMTPIIFDPKTRDPGLGGGG